MDPRAIVRTEGVRLDAVYCCPYHPEGLGEYRREHEDRKPGPGMLQRAARELGVELAQSVMVGDRCSDVGAANAAGLRQAFLLRGTEPEPCPGGHAVVETLAEVDRWLREYIVKQRQPTSPALRSGLGSRTQLLLTEAF